MFGVVYTECVSTSNVRAKLEWKMYVQHLHESRDLSLQLFHYIVGLPIIIIYPMDKFIHFIKFIKYLVNTID